MITTKSSGGYQIRNPIYFCQFFIVVFVSGLRPNNLNKSIVSFHFGVHELFFHLKPREKVSSNWKKKYLNLDLVVA